MLIILEQGYIILATPRMWSRLCLWSGLGVTLGCPPYGLSSQASVPWPAHGWPKAPVCMPGAAQNHGWYIPFRSLPPQWSEVVHGTLVLLWSGPSVYRQGTERAAAAHCCCQLSFGRPAACVACGQGMQMPAAMHAESGPFLATLSPTLPLGV